MKGSSGSLSWARRRIEFCRRAMSASTRWRRSRSAWRCRVARSSMPSRSAARRVRLIARGGGDYQRRTRGADRGPECLPQRPFPLRRVNREQQDAEGIGRERAVVGDLARDLRQRLGALVVFEEEPHPLTVFGPAAVSVRMQLHRAVPEEPGAPLLRPPLPQPTYVPVVDGGAGSNGRSLIMSGLGHEHSRFLSRMTRNIVRASIH